MRRELITTESTDGLDEYEPIGDVVLLLLLYLLVRRFRHEVRVLKKVSNSKSSDDRGHGGTSAILTFAL